MSSPRPPSSGDGDEPAARRPPAAGKPPGPQRPPAPQRPPLGGARVDPPAPPPPPVPVPEVDEQEPAPEPPGRRNRSRRRIGVVSFCLMFALGVLVVGGYAALSLKAGDTVPAGASVAGVDIGGMHTDAAEQRLRTILGARAARPIRVSAAGRSASFSPAGAGLTLDVPDSVLGAGGGHSFWPGRIWRYYTGGHDHDAVTHQRSSRFRAAAKKVAALVDKSDVEGRITFVRGRPVVHQAADGRRVDLARAGQGLTHGFLRSSVSKVDYDVVRPDIDNAALRTAMKDFATPATSGQVTLELKGQKVVASPLRFTQALTMVPDGDQLTPRLDVSRLLAVLEPVLVRLDGTPRPAQIEIDGGRPAVVPSAPGTTFDRKDLAGSFLDLLTQPKGKRTQSVDTVQGPPSFTTADARRMRVTSMVSSSTTPFGYADYRNTNIARAADLIDGTIVQPGQTFSLGETIGRPDRDNGFTPGVEIVGGVFRADAGAGLSQVASTLFNAMFEAGLEDAGHEVTSVYTGRYPLGREASFEYGQDDLRFTNNTKYGALIKAAVSPSSPSDDGSLRIEIWSTKVWDVGIETSKRYDRRPTRVVHKTGAGCDSSVGYPGFSVDVTRVFRKPGARAVDHWQKTTTVYQPSNSVVCDP